MPTVFSKLQKASLSANDWKRLRRINRLRPVLVFIVPKDPSKRKTFASGRSVSLGMTLDEFLLLMQTDMAQAVAEIHIIEQAEYTPGTVVRWVYIARNLDFVSPHRCWSVVIRIVLVEPSPNVDCNPQTKHGSVPHSWIGPI